jgi:hypothetical protein
MPKITKYMHEAPDNLHCLQVCFAMVYNTLLDDAITLADAERLTGYIKDKATWQFQALDSFAERGLEVLSIDRFDLHAFAKEPEATIRRFYTDPKVVEFILAASDCQQEVKVLTQSLTRPNFFVETRIATLADIERLITDDWCVICNVNSAALKGDFENYAGHFVIVESLDEKEAVIHNPGLPPIFNQRIAREVFDKAWNYPDETMATIYAARVAR